VHPAFNKKFIVYKNIRIWFTPFILQKKPHRNGIRVVSQSNHTFYYSLFTLMDFKFLTPRD